MDDPKVVGARIRELRTAAKLTQSALAKELGTESMTISRWERGANEPSPENLRAIADRFGVTPAWIEYGISHDGPSIDASTSQLDDAATAHDRAIFAVGPLEPELEAHLRKRLQEWAFLDGGTMTALVGALESEKSRWKAQRSGMPPKVREAPPLEVEPVEGGMFLNDSRKKRGR